MGKGKGAGGKGGKGGKGRVLCRNWRTSLGGQLGSGCPWGEQCHFRHYWEGMEGEEAARGWQEAREEWWAARVDQAWAEYWGEVESHWEWELMEGVEGEWEVEFRRWWGS